MRSLVALIALSVLELAIAIVILLCTDVNPGPSFSIITNLNAGIPLLIAWGLRNFTLVALWPLTIFVGTGKWPCVRKSLSNGSNGNSMVASMQPMGEGLLENTENTGARTIILTEDNETRAARIQALIAEKIAKAGDAQRRSNGRNALMLFAYVIISLCAVYTALFIVQIQNDEVSGVVLFVIVAYIACLLMSQIDFVLYQNVILARTDTEGVNDDSLHEHPLTWKKAEGYCMCGRCRQLVGEQTGGNIVLACGVCKGWGGSSWAVCAKCYQKHQIQSEEGGGSEHLLRNDKGPVFLPKMTTGGFCWRMVMIMRSFAWFIIFALAATTAVQVLSTYIPKVQGDLLNSLMHGDREQFNKRLLVFGLFTVVVLFLTPLQGWGTSMMVAHLNKHMSDTMYTAIMKQDIAFFDGAMSGQLTSRLQSDLFRITQPMPLLINSVYANTIAILSGLTVCLATSWQLTVLAFVCLSPVLYLTSLYTQWAGKKQLEQYVHMSEGNSLSTQALANVRTVRFSGATDHEVGKFAKTNEKRFETAVTMAIGGMGNSFASSFCQRAAAFFILYYGGELVFGESGFEAGSIYTFTLLWNTLSDSLTSIIQNANQPVTMMSAGKRIFEIMDLEPAIQDKPDAVEISKDVGMELTIKDVHFAYQSRKDSPALRGLNLTVEAGKTTALVGKSGCGKSTVNRLLLRFYDPNAGSILVNNTPLTDLKYAAYIRSIGIVTQDTQLFKATIRDNLTYGLPVGDYTKGDGKEQVERAARLAMADEFIKELPEGYSTMVGEGGHNLSGGQKQRVSIARALMRRPRLLMLDEATSALDTENEALVQESLNQVMAEMQGQCTILVIAHRLATIVDANKIIVFVDGQVAEQGTHTELLERDGEYKRLVQRQLVGGVEPKVSEESGKGKGKGKSKKM